MWGDSYNPTEELAAPLPLIGNISLMGSFEPFGGCRIGYESMQPFLLTISRSA